jgi:RNA polymerase sigma factor (sigma-70 family)
MENDLILKVKIGDREAFHQLYNQYSSYALRTAYAVMSSKEDAGDAVQETFIKVYKNIGSFDESKSFKAWFYRILINECNNIFRKKKPVISIGDFIGNDKQLSKNDIYAYEENEAIFKPLEQLKEIYRTPIILKYINNFSEKEIANILELNVNTLKSRLFKGREKLKQIIESYEECAK